MWQFFFCFCYYFFEWVTERVSEFLALLPRSSALSAHTEFERARDRGSRERSVEQRKRVCVVCVRQYTCLHQYTHTRSTHLLSRTHDMHSTFARCSAAALLCRGTHWNRCLRCGRALSPIWTTIPSGLASSLSICKQNVFAFKVSKSSSNNL